MSLVATCLVVMTIMAYNSLIVFVFQNRAELTSGVRQDILDYSVSVNGEVILTSCSNTSSSCSYFYDVQPPASLSTVLVSARNIFGRGQERTCNLTDENISKSIHGETLTHIDGTHISYIRV